MVHEITSYEQLLDELAAGESAIVYTTTRSCNVCVALQPRVEKLAEEYGVPLLTLCVDDVPLAAGQLNLFSSPAVLIYCRGKELLRQDRFIAFARIERVLQQMTASV